MIYEWDIRGHNCSLKALLQVYGQRQVSIRAFGRGARERGAGWTWGKLKGENP